VSKDSPEALRYCWFRGPLIYGF